MHSQRYIMLYKKVWKDYVADPVLTSVYTWHLDSTWYTPDFYTVITDI
jgi:hypothetical protein